MPATRRQTPKNNPLLIWMNLGWKTAEMLAASAQVINHRTQQMSTSAAQPSDKDLKEFSLMGQEKVEAAIESFQSMGIKQLTMNQRLWQQYLEQFMAVCTALLSLGTSRTVSQSLKRQQELNRAMLKSAKTGARLLDSTTKLASRGLDPIHAKATANAKRLSS